MKKYVKKNVNLLVQNVNLFVPLTSKCFNVCMNCMCMCNKSRNKEHYTNLILSYCQTLSCSPVEIQISITEAEYNTKSSLN